MAPAASLDERLRQEVRGLIFRNAYVGIAGGCLALVGLALVDWDFDINGQGHRWVLALFICLMGRWAAVMLERHQQGRPFSEQSSFPFRLYYTCSVLEGLTWGASMFVFFPENLLNQAFLMIVLIALAIGGLAVFSGSASLSGIYAASIIGGAFLKLVGMESEVYGTLAALTPVLLTVVLVIAHRMNGLFLKLMTVSFRNEQLAMVEAASKLSIIDYSEKLSAKSKEVERVTKRLRKLVTVLSSDLRAQLVTVCQLSRLLGQSERSDADNQFVVTTLQQSAEGGLKLVEDLLHVTSPESSALQVDLREYQLQEMVENVMKNAQETARIKEVSLHSAVDDQRPVAADPARIEEVLSNLIDNAIAVTPSKGSITVQTIPTPKGLRLEVIDSGEGIDATTMSELFEPPQGAPSSGYSMINLSHAQKILKAHDSLIEVKNNPTKGSCFSFVLPWANK